MVFTSVIGNHPDRLRKIADIDHTIESSYWAGDSRFSTVEILQKVHKRDCDRSVYVGDPDDQIAGQPSFSR
jgi:hypothetical protein